MSRSLLYAGLSAAAILGAMTIVIETAKADDKKPVTVVSWGGAYTKSQVEAYHKPFTAETGIPITSADYNGGIAEVKAQVESGNVVWDIVDMEVGDALRACDEGLLEPLDPSSFPAGADGTPATEDFYPDALTDCWATSIIFSTVFAYDDSKIGPDKPTTIGDFFDLQKFPGKRGLRKQNPKATLEMALLADGVAPDDIYAVLATPEGLDRAFAKLDTIKKEIVWWEAGAQAPQLLASGEVTMTTAWNGRIFNANKEGQNFKIVWDNQILDSNYWVIPKGAKNPEASLAFIKYAAEPKVLAGITKYIPYGPVRKSAAEFVAPEDAKNLPTSPQNLTTSLTLDNGFWADHGDEIRKRFTTWLSN